MAKLSEYRPQTMTRDEQRDMNRQIFLNLPKTPTTPWLIRSARAKSDAIPQTWSSTRSRTRSTMSSD